MNTEPTWSIEKASARLQSIKERLDDNDPRLNAIFTQTFFEKAFEQVINASANEKNSLAGAIVTIKDLLDVEGFVTKAGTRFMENNPPAQKDAETVRRLREAGAIFLGHTNMTELAYSGLGLNPHYGTPENALLKGRIPGGSTSGGAVSVARGIADIAIGTDTGGSLRIPAAFNGIVGFKPTQATVSRQGCKPLSRSLDSIGPMANTVAECELAYRILAGDEIGKQELDQPEFIIPKNYGMDDLDPVVHKAFHSAVNCLRSAGFMVHEAEISVLEQLKSLPVWHFSAIESRGEYDEAYHKYRDLIDPRIAGPTRMGRANEVDAVTYRKTLNKRSDLIESYKAEMDGRILLMPTVPILAPSFSELEVDEDYNRLNLQVLRNPSIANVMDCCSVSLPFRNSGHAIGVMVTACGQHDISLLKIASKLEVIFSP